MGSDVNATTPNGSTGLHFLALLSREEAAPAVVYLQILAELVKKGASLGLLNASGEGVLHMAASRRNEAAVSFFLEHGCEVNVQTKQGETALHYAVSQGSVPILERLLDAGALDRPNVSMERAAERAVRLKMTDAVEVFERKAFSRAVAQKSLGRSDRSVAALRGGGAEAGPSTPPPSAANGAAGGGGGGGGDEEIVVVEAAEREEDPFADESDHLSEADRAAVAFQLSAAVAERLAVTGGWEIYRNEFFGKRHHVYYGGEGTERAFVVVVARPGPDGQYRALLIAGGDWTAFSFSAELLVLYAGCEESDQLRQVLTTMRTTGGREWTPFRFHTGVLSGNQLLALEAKLAMRPRLCVGVVLALPGQTHEAEMFENTASASPPEFDAFLGLLGESVDVGRWRHWRGTFPPTEEPGQRAYYTAWRGFEFVFHVSTLLDAAKQRQHIGNDTCLIVFKLGSDRIERTFRGKVNALSLVVSPVPDAAVPAVAVSAFYRRWIEGFSPVLPDGPLALSQAAQLREVLFTNVINGTFAAVRSGPYRQNRLRLYEQALGELVTAEEEGVVAAGAERAFSPRKPDAASSSTGGGLSSSGMQLTSPRGAKKVIDRAPPTAAAAATEGARAPVARPAPAAAEAPPPHVVANPEKLAELITQAMEYVRRKGLAKVNIFRHVEDAGEVDTLAVSWERGQRTDLERENVVVVAGAIRKYFRDQETLFTMTELEQLVAASKRPPEEQLEVLRAVLAPKPMPMKLLELLNRVDEKHAVNKMSASNSAAVFAPTFLRAAEQQLNGSLLLEFTKGIVATIQLAIQHFQCCQFGAPTCKWAHESVAPEKSGYFNFAQAGTEEDVSTSTTAASDEDVWVRQAEPAVARPVASAATASPLNIDLDLDEVERVMAVPARRVASPPPPSVAAPSKATTKRAAPQAPPQKRAPEAPDGGLIRKSPEPMRRKAQPVAEAEFEDDGLEQLNQLLQSAQKKKAAGVSPRGEDVDAAGASAKVDEESAAKPLPTPAQRKPPGSGSPRPAPRSAARPGPVAAVTPVVVPPQSEEVALVDQLEDPFDLT